MIILSYPPLPSSSCSVQRNINAIVNLTANPAIPKASTNTLTTRFPSAFGAAVDLCKD
jgi:hypothetical protein